MGRAAEKGQQNHESDGSLADCMVTDLQELNFDKSVYKVVYLWQETEACEAA